MKQHPCAVTYEVTLILATYEVANGGVANGGVANGLTEEIGVDLGGNYATIMISGASSLLQGAVE